MLDDFSDDESCAGSNFVTSDWDHIYEQPLSSSTPHPDIFGDNHSIGSMSFNPRTGKIEINGPAGLVAGALGALALFAGRGNNDSYEERQRRLEAELEAQKAKRQKEEAERAKEEAEEQAARAQKENQAAQEKLKLEEELRMLGLEPDHDITDEEIRTARKTIGYVDNHVNIGVVGGQNEGKSTLVNCFRGISHRAPGSARVREAEETKKSTPYPDYKHSGVIWHDIPGGGTERNTAWRYYYDQKLFAYDKLLLVHSSTLKQMDRRVLQISKHFGQKCVVVRSKSDEHIRNCQRNCGHETVEAARDDYISQVREDTAIQNETAGKAEALCPHYTDYIVCEMGVSQLVNESEVSESPYEQVIDEERLLKALGLKG